MVGDERLDRRGEIRWVGNTSDLIQGPNDRYDGNWLDDVIANGGGEAYGVVPRF